MRKEDITFQEKLNELRLDISNPKSKGRIFVLVEGDGDIRLFRKFFNIQYCNVECVPGGRTKLEECVSELIKLYRLVIGIRDADFEHLEYSKYLVSNVFLTDYHDIEMTMLAQDEILNALVFEYTDLDKTKHIGLKVRVLQTIKSIGFLKWLNDIEDLGFNFNFSFHDLIDFSNQSIDLSQYINILLSKSPDAKITDAAVIQSKIRELEMKNPDLMQLTNGHDLLKAFSKYFRETHGHKSLSYDILASSFRMSFTFEIFKKTELFNQTSSWEKDNGVIIYQ